MVPIKVNVDIHTHTINLHFYKFIPREVDIGEGDIDTVVVADDAVEVVVALGDTAVSLKQRTVIQ